MFFLQPIAHQPPQHSHRPHPLPRIALSRCSRKACKTLHSNANCHCICSFMPACRPRRCWRWMRTGGGARARPHQWPPRTSRSAPSTTLTRSWAWTKTPYGRPGSRCARPEPFTLRAHTVPDGRCCMARMSIAFQPLPADFGTIFQIDRFLLLQAATNAHEVAECAACSSVQTR